MTDMRMRLAEELARRRQAPPQPRMLLSATQDHGRTRRRKKKTVPQQLKNFGGDPVGNGRQKSPMNYGDFYIPHSRKPHIT
jgi:hypothetical protein